MRLRKATGFGGLSVVGMPYALTWHGQLAIVNFSNSSILEILPAEEHTAPPGVVRFASYLVESSDEVFLVLKIYQGCTREVDRLGVYEMDFSMMAWLEVEDLGDRVFILGMSGWSTSCSATEIGVRGNHIYFIENEDEDLCEFDLKDAGVSVCIPCPQIHRSVSKRCWILPGVLLQKISIEEEETTAAEKKEQSRELKKLDIVDEGEIPTDIDLGVGDATKELSKAEEGKAIERDPRTSMFDLPLDLWLLIGLCSTFEDIKSLTLVCKTWREVARTVRHKFHFPLFVYCPPNESKCRLVHPKDKLPHESESKLTNNIESLLDFSDITVHCFKDGWLLLSRWRLFWNFFFFNLFTEATIELPDLDDEDDIGNGLFALSSSPASPDCMIFAINLCARSCAEIYMCSVGDDTWTDHCFEHPRLCPSPCASVFYDDAFCTSGLDGRLGVFDPRLSKWTVVPKPNGHKDLSIHSCSELYENFIGQNFLVESGGKLLHVYIGHIRESIHIFCLNRQGMQWEEIHTLRDRTLFLSRRTSLSMLFPLKGLQNKIYFPEICGEDGFLFYSFEGCRYNCDMDLHRPKQLRYGTWIESRWSQLIDEKLQG